VTDLLPLAKAKVASCTSCWLHTAGNGPVPPRGPSPAPIVVVGEAPGPEEDASRRPFVGPAGRLLANLLRESRIDPDRHVGYVNIVSCWPGRPKKGKGFRVPALDEQAACRTNLLISITAFDPKIVVLLGATALNAFRPDLMISRDRGRPLVIPGLGHIVVPTYHPSAALRAKHLEKSIRSDLQQVRWRWKKDHPPGWARWPEDCRLCGDPVEAYDDNGIAFCHRHDPERGKIDATHATPMSLLAT
jgi:uracil-DNA glycosylase